MRPTNPYQSPETPKFATFSPRFDAGKLAARYLKFLACMSIVAMLIGLFFFNKLNFDVSPLLLFWTAKHLANHSRTARKWVIGICYFNLFAIASMLALTLCYGTGEDSPIEFRSGIDVPDLWQIAVFSIILSVLVAIPIWILRTPEAKREFAA